MRLFRFTGLVLLIGFFLIQQGKNKVFAQAPNLLAKNEEQAMEVLKDSVRDKVKRGALFLFGIEEKLEGSKQELQLLRNNVALLEEKIDDSKINIENLESQLKNVDALRRNTEKKIRAVLLLIAESKNSLLILEDDKKQRERDLAKLVGSLDDLLQASYFQNNIFFTQEEPILVAFLADSNPNGNALRENSYFLFLQQASDEMAEKIAATERQIKNEQNIIETKNGKLNELQSLLIKEKRMLEAAQQSKQKLLTETKGKQIIYESLLELSKKEFEQVNVQIQRLRENYEFFQTRLDALKQNPEAFKVTTEELDLDEGEEILAGKSKLAWPISPSLGISAYFRDGAYKKALGIQHNAIDIRIVQGSKVRAAGNGVVTKVADNGFGYSYIILAHPDKLITLYGHMSEMFVEEGEIVKQGQVIGLSGGIPGTKGAGWLTTGAHLHFEVFRDFQHTDPLNYLPLEYLPVTSLPEKYLKKVFGSLGDPVD